MHNLSLVDELGSSTVVVVEPEGLGLEKGFRFEEEAMVEESYAIANIAVINLSAKQNKGL
jgi:hypothetical protein